MATKVIYFTVYGNDEQAEFRTDDSTDDVKGERFVFRLLERCNNVKCYFYATRIERAFTF